MRTTLLEGDECVQESLLIELREPLLHLQCYLLIESALLDVHLHVESQDGAGLIHLQVGYGGQDGLLQLDEELCSGVAGVVEGLEDGEDLLGLEAAAAVVAAVGGREVQADVFVEVGVELKTRAVGLREEAQDVDDFGRGQGVHARPHLLLELALELLQLAHHPRGHVAPDHVQQLALLEEHQVLLHVSFTLQTH